MNELLKKLREQRAALITQARAIYDAAEAAKRGLTPEEQSNFDTLMKQADDIQADIARRERLGTAETGLSQPATQGNRPDPNIGMSQREIQRYSLIRAIRAAADAPKNPRAWDSARFELEASEAVAQRMGKAPQGFYVPYDFLAERRDLTVGTPTAGGNLVATDLMADSFIDMLRNRLVLRAAGATMLTGLVGNIAIPRQTGGATSYWVSENSAITSESQQTVDQVTMSPKTVGAYTDIARKLLLQSSVDVEAFVRRDLSSVQALAIDLAGLHGTGLNNQPTGVAGINGIGSVVGGADGAAPTWANIVSLETEVAQDNADIGTLAYVTNAKVRGKLKSTAKAANTAEMVWDARYPDTPLNGYRAPVSNQVASNLTKGNGTSLSAIFFGNWADLLIGMWGALDILVDPYTGATAGTVRVVTLQDVDIAVRHAESFAAMLDAVTA